LDLYVFAIRFLCRTTFVGISMTAFNVYFAKTFVTLFSWFCSEGNFRNSFIYAISIKGKVKTAFTSKIFPFPVPFILFYLWEDLFLLFIEVKFYLQKWTQNRISLNIYICLKYSLSEVVFEDFELKKRRKSLFPYSLYERKAW
jgi:hypothetical protein